MLHNRMLAYTETNVIDIQLWQYTELQHLYIKLFSGGPDMGTQFHFVTLPPSLEKIIYNLVIYTKCISEIEPLSLTYWRLR